LVDWTGNSYYSTGSDNYLSLPTQAIQCYLADVIPLEEGETWSKACIEKFKSLADQRLVTAVATGKMGRTGVFSFHTAVLASYDNRVTVL
jgi:hypothetical protein